MFLLGNAYFNGSGVDQDYEEAVRWFKLAAENGEPDSMVHLGFCYQEGIGVEKDIDTAWDYIYKAAELGWQPAIYILDDAGLLEEDEEEFT